MLKSIRKHNKWLMVGFGVLLMVTWLVQPAINQFNSAVQNRTVGKLDGKTLSARQMALAAGEVAVVARLVPGVAGAIGVADRDPVHWLLLAHEAEDGGFIGGPKDGEDWNELLSATAFELAYQQFGESTPQIARMMPSMLQRFFDQAPALVPQRITGAAADQRFTIPQVHTALARARGIKRMVDAYRTAGRMSDRAAIVKAREYLDSATANYVFVPADRVMDTIPDPDAAMLQAHYDAYKTVKPGEGEFGVGYLLPPRVKIEYMKLDRTAIDAAIVLDPVEVRRKYNQGKGPTGKYPGEFVAEKARIEAEMKGEIITKVMQEAQVAVQTEVLRATKILEPDGKYRKLPDDWEARRPRYEAIAQHVVDAVRRATDVTIPLPTVVVKGADWLTRDELRALPDIGMSRMRAGGLEKSFDDVVFWTRELPGGQADESLIAVQTGVPLAETYLTDFSGNRFYLTVLATKGESSPDSIDEKREQIVKDFKRIKGFEQLRSRSDEIRGMAVSGGLDAVIAAFPAAEAPKPDPAKPDVKPADDARFKALEVTKDVTVGSEVMGNRDPIMGSEGVFKQVLETAAKIDPLLPREQVPADPATLSIPIPKRLGLAVIRILNPDPVTTEKFRQFDLGVVQESQRRELSEVEPNPEQDPFSLANLLKRHKYTSGERDIKTLEDLKQDETKGSGS